MNPELLPLLACPQCHQQPELICFEVEAPAASANNRSEQVASGVLGCKCGAVYPIIDGVPRFLPDAVSAFPEFLSRHQKHLTQLGDVTPSRLSEGLPAEENDYDNIRRSFSQEWGLFDYHSDKTWGWTLKDRKRVFLSDVSLDPTALVGKSVLDAGCGNGTLTAALSDFNFDIVGLDLNDGLGRAYANRLKYAANAGSHVHYIQGNVVDPPLKDASFDLVYSSGVIHHTPSSKRAFDSLVRLTKPNGRLYVWVYGKRGILVRAFFSFGRNLKNWMSLKSVLLVCRILAPAYKVAANGLDFLGVMRFRSRTSREITLDLFDAFAPRYNHWHTKEQVRSWFQEHGFRNIRVSGIQKHGFGMYGDKS